MARYNDGSSWCFGCHLFQKPTLAPPWPQPKAAANPDYPEKQAGTSKWFDLPADATRYYGPEARKWLESYPMPQSLLLENDVVWSPTRQQLIYKFLINGELVAWQARNFGIAREKSKVFTSGNVTNLIKIYGLAKNPDTLVIVEDPLSAINVSRVLPCMPLLGSHMPLQKVQIVSKLYEQVVVWLDPDKFTEGQKIAHRLSLMNGCTARAILTNRDPKYYTEMEITHYLEEFLK